MIYTVAQLAAEMHLSRWRVHQIMTKLSLQPERLGGAGPYVLTGRQRRQLLDRKLGRPGRPRKPAAPA